MDRLNSAQVNARQRGNIDGSTLGSQPVGRLCRRHQAFTHDYQVASRITAECRLRQTVVLI